MKSEKRIVIVGAGIAGLVLSHKLTQAGCRVLLVEKEPSIGGLAKSFEYDGVVFDIGPHRFHTDLPEVMNLILEVLEDDYLTIERKSGVWMFGKYFDWPLKLSSLARMPLPVLLSVAADLLHKVKKTGRSFEDYIVSRYGQTLYGIFFKPYTEKFLGIPCPEISRDWAVTGIDRAVIDSKIEVSDLRSLAGSMFNPRPPLKFIYPRSGGIGVFAEKLKNRIIGNAGRILVSAKINDIIRKDNNIEKVVIDGVAHDCDLLVWTGSIDDILSLLNCGPTGLEYLAQILYNYTINGNALLDYQWCYFGSEHIPFNRISVPSLFNPALAPPGKTGICAEVTCRMSDSSWQCPEALEPLIRKALAEVGIISGSKDILDLHVERIANAYPVYSLDYKERLDEAAAFAGQFRNLKLLGRTGAFWYNNMDHSIAAAIGLAREILAGEGA